MDTPAQPTPAPPMSMRWVFMSLVLLAAVVVLTLFQGLAPPA